MTRRSQCIILYYISKRRYPFSFSHKLYSFFKQFVYTHSNLQIGGNMYILATFFFVGGGWFLISAIRNLLFCLFSWNFDSFYMPQQLIIAVICILLGLGAYLIGQKIKAKKRSPEEQERDRLLEQSGPCTCRGCGMNLKDIRIVKPNEIKYIDQALYCPVCAFNLKENKQKEENQ